jgi:Domain of unknown function (DUF4136)
MSSLLRFARLVAPLALLGLGACATPFNAQVSRFQALPVPQGQTFTIAPADPKNSGGLEFAQYARLVSQKLAAVGYAPAADAASANLVVTLDYGVDQGKERTRTAPFSGYGYGGYGYGGFGYGGFGRHNIGYSPYYGYGRRGFIYGFYDPFLFGSGYGETETYTVYTSGLEMQIARKGGERVFEGKAEAMSSDNLLPRLVPNLIEAMFTGFPGNSGEVVKISVAPPSKR